MDWGTVLTVFGALGGVGMGAWLNRSSGDRRWRRDLRLRVYLDAVRTLRQAISAGDQLAMRCQTIETMVRHGVQEADLTSLCDMADKQLAGWFNAIGDARNAADEIRLIGSSKVQVALDQALVVVSGSFENHAFCGDLQDYINLGVTWDRDASERTLVWGDVVDVSRAELGLAD